jgi:hypothetical protein
MTEYGYAVATVNAEGEVRNAVRLPSWALSSTSGASVSERMVAVALSALEAGHAVPSMAWIAGRCGLSKRTVRRVLSRMRADGRVKAVPRFDVLSGRQLPSGHVLVMD